jgi:hypothetical protein
MNLDALHKKLIAAARSHPPGDGVPYAFEKRVMAHLRARPEPDAWTLWGRALWRAAAPCVAVTLVLAAWTMLSINRNGANASFAQNLDQTVLASVDGVDESW